MSAAERETAIRILGARDGYAHVLADLKREIGRIMDTPIHPRHVKRLAERDRLLRPLVAMRDKYERQAQECREAYSARMAGLSQ